MNSDWSSDVCSSDLGQKGERSYGAVLKNGEKYAFAPYAAAFEKEVKRVADALDKLTKKYLLPA